MILADTVAAILDELKTVFEEVKQEKIDAFADVVAGANRIFVTGAGRVGTCSRAFAMRVTHLGKPAHWVSDDTTPRIGEGDVLVANSGSGGSPSTYNIARQAKDAGAAVVTITANPTGKISQLSDAVIHLPAQTYKTDKSSWSSVLPMGSQFEISLWILHDVIALTLTEKMNCTEASMMQFHRNLE